MNVIANKQKQKTYWTFQKQNKLDSMESETTNRHLRTNNEDEF